MLARLFRSAPSAVLRRARPSRARRRRGPSRCWEAERLEDRRLLSGDLLDPTFGSAGVLRTDVEVPSSSYALALVATQADGKVVVVGAFGSNDAKSKDGEQVSVARYDADGSLDASFDGDGMLALPIGTIRGATSVAVDAQGRIVILGSGNSSKDGVGDLVVVRLDSDGGLDASFGVGDRAMIDFGSFDTPSGVAIDPSGGIVAVGTSMTDSGSYDFAVTRLDADGTPDLSFGSQGLATVDFGGSTGFDFARAVAVDPSGRIVIAGDSYTPGLNAFAAVRLTGGGMLDPSFGDGGRVRVGLGAQVVTSASGVALDPAGRIVLAGSSVDLADPEGDWDFTAVRLDSAGALDGGFGSGGVATVGFGATVSEDYADGVAIDSAGRILLAGEAQGAGDGSDFAVARLTASGALDLAFGDVGWAVFGFGEGSDDLAYAVAVDAADRVLVAGSAEIPGAPDLSDFALARLATDGTPDPGFGGDGRVTTGVVAPGAVSGGRVAVQADGKIVMATIGGDDGAVKGGTSLWIVVTRTNADGSPDTGFGPAGQVRYPVPTWLLRKATFTPLGLAIDPAGRILLVGQAWSGDTSRGLDMLVMRLRPDGSLDPAFGEGGHVLMDFGVGSFEEATGVAVDDNGRIVVVGTGDSLEGRQDFAVARLNDDGSLDLTFGQYGLATVDLGGYERAYDMAIDQAGRIVLVGESEDLSGLGLGFAVARLNPDGSPDATFGVDGGVVLRFGEGYREDWANSVAIDGAGRIVAAGQVGPDASGGAAFGAIRLDTGGALDPAFGAGGWATLSFGTAGSSDVANGVGIDAAGRALLVGSTYNWTTGAHDIALARLGANGTPDAAFGDGGRAALNLGTAETDDEAFDLAFDPLGRAVVVGRSGGAGKVSDTSLVAGPLLVALRLPGGPPPVIDVDPATIAQDLQSIVGILDAAGAGTSPTVTLNVVSGDMKSVLDAVADLQLDPGGQVIDIVLDLQGSTFGLGRKVDVPAGVRLTIEGANRSVVIVGQSPALTLASGELILHSVTLTNSTDAATVVVEGGHLTVRDSVIAESTGYAQVALLVTGGAVDLGTQGDEGGNTVNVNGDGELVRNTSGQPVTAVGTAFLIDGVVLAASSLSGFVFEDFNNDGEVDFGEDSISGVTTTLDGSDFLGTPVHDVRVTDLDGAYIFRNLLPGSYRITESQPADYAQGISSVGTIDDTTAGSLTGVDQFELDLGAGLDALNYNYGERPAASGAVGQGQTAGIGFWNNKHGQALIKSLNGGQASTQLGTWLAATFPNMFGPSAGANDLDGKTNTQVAAFFQSRFVLKGEKLDAQVLATALAVYVTNATLNSTGAGAQSGFVISGDGVGTAIINVGAGGVAFGVADDSPMTVLDLLLAVDARAVDGVLYGGDAARRSEANAVFGAINQAGRI